VRRGLRPYSLLSLRPQRSAQQLYFRLDAAYCALHGNVKSLPQLLRDVLVPQDLTSLRIDVPYVWDVTKSGMELLFELACKLWLIDQSATGEEAIDGLPDHLGPCADRRHAEVCNGSHEHPRMQHSLPTEAMGYLIILPTVINQSHRRMDENGS